MTDNFFYIICESCHVGYSFDKKELRSEIDKHLGHTLKVTDTLIRWPHLFDRQKLVQQSE
jgi:hypothetical protein